MTAPHIIPIELHITLKIAAEQVAAPEPVETLAAAIEPKVAEEGAKPAPARRKRRTKAQIEADKKAEEAKAAEGAEPEPEEAKAAEVPEPAPAEAKAAEAKAEDTGDDWTPAW